MKLDAGKLDRRITLQRATITRDEMNSPVQTWNTLALRWAAYQAVSDGEKFAAGQVSASISGRFQIRYGLDVADLNPKDRLIFDGKTYDIIGVKEIERRCWLEITAATRADT